MGRSDALMGRPGPIEQVLRGQSSANLPRAPPKPRRRGLPRPPALPRDLFRQALKPLLPVQRSLRPPWTARTVRLYARRKW
jgi:hypothetical protein